MVRRCGRWAPCTASCPSSSTPACWRCRSTSPPACCCSAQAAGAAMTKPLFSPSRRGLLATACVPVLPAAFSAAAQAARREWPRQRATPTVELAGLDGSAWQLAATRGKPVLLNFWASWCEPCRAEMPALQQLAREHRGEGVQVLAVNYKEGEAAVRRFLQATGLELPVLLDREGAAAK